MRYKNILICILLVGLAACSKQSASDALDTVGDDTSSGWNKMRDAVGLGHTSKTKPEDRVQPRYCYKTMQDVLCYPTPIAGQEYRLTGYQQANGRTGYVLPASPALPPTSTLSGSTGTPQKSTRTPPSVTDSGGPGGNKTQLKEVIFDPAELEPKELVPDKEQ